MPRNSPVPRPGIRLQGVTEGRAHEAYEDEPRLTDVGDQGGDVERRRAPQSQVQQDGQEAELLEELQDSGSITIGIANEAPFGFVGEDGELKGQVETFQPPRDTSSSAWQDLWARILGTGPLR